MADEFRNLLEGLMEHLSDTYSALVAASAQLPIPVILPEPKGFVELTVFIDSVARLADLSEDQPMPEEQQALLFNGAILFIAGLDLTAIAAKVHFSEHPGAGLRLLAAETNLLLADEALAELLDWLNANS